MTELLDSVLEAHGGLDRWNRFQKITATIVGGGGLWPLKGVELDPGPREMTAMFMRNGRPSAHSANRTGTLHSGPTGSRLKPLKTLSSKNARIPEPPLPAT